MCGGRVRRVGGRWRGCEGMGWVMSGWGGGGEGRGREGEGYRRVGGARRGINGKGGGRRSRKRDELGKGRFTAACCLRMWLPRCCAQSAAAEEHVGAPAWRKQPERFRWLVARSDGDVLLLWPVGWPARKPHRRKARKAWPKPPRKPRLLLKRVATQYSATDLYTPVS